MPPDGVVTDIRNEFRDLATLTESDWFAPMMYNTWLRGVNRHLSVAGNPPVGFELLYRYAERVHSVILEMTHLARHYTMGQVHLIHVKRTIWTFIGILIVNVAVRLTPSAHLLDQVIIAGSFTAIALTLESLILVFLIIARTLDVDNEEFKSAWYPEDESD